MGTNLEDGISQGEAVGNEFRTAPLWVLGTSEANGVIRQFDRLSESDKQDLLNFLRSL